MNIKEFIEELNSTFGEPFLPKGFFQATYQEPEGNNPALVNIYIGRRDVSFIVDDDGLTFAGAGTSLISNWVISDEA